MIKTIVLGGGADQADLICELKKRGHYTILIDYTQTPIAKRVADKFYKESTLDMQKVYEIASRENADYVLTSNTDQALLTMAYVSEKLTLPCLFTYEQVRNFTNKTYMKAIMKHDCIPTSNHIAIKTGTEDISSLRFPLIVKPADCNSSKGVRKVESINEYNHFVKKALKLSRTHTAIVEEFVSGDEISIDAYITGDGVKVLMVGMLKKKKINESTEVIYQNVIPAPISKKALHSIPLIAEKIAHAFHLTNTPLLIQAIVDHDSVNVIEFSARLGGGAKHRTIEKYTGFDVMNANIDSMLGLTPKIPSISTTKTLSRIHLYPTSGLYQSTEGMDQMMSRGIITEFIANKTPGTKFTVPKASTDRLGSCLVEADDYEMLNWKIQTLLDNIKILDPSGNNIFDKSFYPY